MKFCLDKDHAGLRARAARLESRGEDFELQIRALQANLLTERGRADVERMRADMLDAQLQAARKEIEQARADNAALVRQAMDLAGARANPGRPERKPQTVEQELNDPNALTDHQRKFKGNRQSDANFTQALDMYLQGLSGRESLKEFEEAGYTIPEK